MENGNNNQVFWKVFGVVGVIVLGVILGVVYVEYIQTEDSNIDGGQIENQENTRVVSKEGDYSCVQDAIDAASPGETVLIKEVYIHVQDSGTYEENLTIDKDLTLRGMGSDKTKINGVKEGHPVLLVGPSEVEVTIEKLTLREAEGVWCENESQGICAFGLSVTGESRVTVSQTQITENTDPGLGLHDSAQASLKNCQITENHAGLRLSDSAQASVEDSRVADNGSGLRLSDSAQASVEDSRVAGNTNGFWLFGSARVILKNNSLRENGDVIEVEDPSSFSGTIDGSGNQISGNKNNFRGVSRKTQEMLLSPPDQE